MKAHRIYTQFLSQQIDLKTWACELSENMLTKAQNHKICISESIQLSIDRSWMETCISKTISFSDRSIMTQNLYIRVYSVKLSIMTQKLYTRVYFVINRSIMTQNLYIKVYSTIDWSIMTQNLYTRVYLVINWSIMT